MCHPSLEISQIICGRPTFRLIFTLPFSKPGFIQKKRGHFSVSCFDLTDGEAIPTLGYLSLPLTIAGPAEGDCAPRA